MALGLKIFIVCLEDHLICGVRLLHGDAGLVGGQAVVQRQPLLQPRHLGPGRGSDGPASDSHVLVILVVVAALDVDIVVIVVVIVVIIVVVVLVVVDVVGGVDHGVDDGEDEGKVSHGGHLAGLPARLARPVREEHHRVLLPISIITRVLQY